MAGDPAPSRTTWNHGPVGMAARLILSAIALLLMLPMTGAHQTWRDSVDRNFALDLGLWITFVAYSLLVGALFCLALILPARVTGFRWVRVLAVGLPPLAVVILGLAIQAAGLPSIGGPFGAAARVFGALNPIAHAAAGMFLGAAAVVGLAEPKATHLD